MVNSENLFRHEFHAIGYYLQLVLWKQFSQVDVWYRMLSMFWGAAAVLVTWSWGGDLSLHKSARLLACVLMATNAFFLQYTTEVRFYAYFLAASCLVFWRLTVFLDRGGRLNAWLWLLSCAMVVTAHLFGWIVLGVSLAVLLWTRKGTKKLLALGGIVVALGVLLVVYPPVKQILIDFVYTSSNIFASPPRAASRGLSFSHFVKIPHTFYVFLVGEKLYPLLWAVTIPALAVLCLKLDHLRRSLPSLNLLPRLNLMAILSVGAVFLILDPVAPPGLQGAAPRYVIYALPVFLMAIAEMAQRSLWILILIVYVNVAGCLNFLMPQFLDGARKNMLSEIEMSIHDPARSCLLSDGRSYGFVERYVKDNVSVVATRIQDLEFGDCDQVLVLSNHWDIKHLRYLDDFAFELDRRGYASARNVTSFPAQLGVYERGKGGSIHIPVSRLSLKEQDLELPAEVPFEPRFVEGFLRLDAARPTRTVRISLRGYFYVLTTVMVSENLPKGTPVFGMTFTTNGEERYRHTYRLGVDTAAWDSNECEKCSVATTWSKRAHLVGSSYYPGAYKEFEARIWAVPVEPILDGIDEVTLDLIEMKANLDFFGFYKKLEER